ncbi:hypothetical protein B0H10DRAFT_2166065 [Mycena sp. CBHHK59/15]|nr:hypothetical protein B0H10DRAFT_2166065 [Mycena sp. CBHHK59/15]
MAALLSLLKPVAYASLPHGRYYTRTLIYVGTVGFVATLGAFYAAGLALVGRKYDVNHAVARTFYALAGTAMSLSVEEGSAILMGNHQSMLDLIPVGRFYAAGPFMTMSGAVFIDRGNSARAMRSLDAAVNLMRSLRISLWMYPEGTRYSSEYPDMLPFKKGGFHLAVQAGIPIIPFVTENYWRLYHKNVFDSGVIRVRVLPPIPTAGLTAADVPALVTLVRQQMLAALLDISVKVPPPPASEKPAPPPEPASDSSAAAVISDVVSEHTAVMPEDAAFDAASTSNSSTSRESLSGSGFEGVAGSENGTETEEDDEGMVLVGRPA